MSKIKQMLEAGVKHFRSSNLDMFRLGDNEKALVVLSAWDDVDEPPRFLTKRTPSGRRIVSGEDSLTPEDRTTWLYAYPAFTNTQGWCVLVGTFGRNSLLSKIMTLLEALGDYEAPFAVHRKGTALNTEYYVYPASTLFKPDEVEKFLSEFRDKEDLKPRAKDAESLVTRVLGNNTSEEE